MIPFPSQMITLKSGGNQMKFTHGRNPPSFPIENVQEGFWPLQLPIFYNGNGVGLRPWVNFVWSSPDFRVTIYDGNGHISPARKTRFGFDHILSHPIPQLRQTWEVCKDRQNVEILRGDSTNEINLESVPVNGSRQQIFGEILEFPFFFQFPGKWNSRKSEKKK